MRHVLAFVLVVALGAWMPPALAQETARLAGELEAKPRQPKAIDVGDIPIRADDDERFAAEVVLLATGTDPFAPLAPRLTNIEHSVAEKRGMFQYDELRSLPVLRLEGLSRHWNFDQRQFDRWRVDMQAVSEPFTSAAAELAYRNADWQATLVANPAGTLPDALSRRIPAVLGELKRAEKALSAPLAKQIELGRRANALEARIQAGQRSVSAAITRIDQRLLHLDSPPLWSVTAATPDSTAAVDSISKGLAVEGEFMTQYEAASLGNQRVLNVLQLALLPLLLWLAVRNRRDARGGDAALGRVLARPFSSWLLLSMIGVLVLEPDAPLMLHQLAMLVALIPVLRLLPPQGRDLLGVWPYVATALYLLQRIAFVLLANAVVYRWYYLCLTLLAMGLTLWLLWRTRHRLHVMAQQRIVRAVAWVAVAVLFVSAACNVVGNVSLAETLTSATIDVGYLALVLYATANVLFTLLRLLFARREVSRMRVIHQHADGLLQLSIRLLTVAAFVGWLVFATNRFRVFRPSYAFVHSVLTHRFGYGELSISLGLVLAFVVGIFLTYWIARGVRLLLKEEVLSRMALPRGVDSSIASLSYYAMLLIGLLFALSAAGIEVGQLAVLFGALGVGVGLGLQDVVKNFVSGLILMFERPVKPGDVVDISGTTGRVRDIGMRATTIKTFDGADVVVPNGMLLADKLTNWTLADRSLRLEVAVGVAYGSDVELVMRTLQQTVRATANVASSPEPVVLFMGLGASSLDFVVRAWARDFDASMEVRSELNARVYAALTAAGVQIPFPQRDLHLQSVSDQVVRALAGLRNGGAATGEAP